jgi:hypothetical protein
VFVEQAWFYSRLPQDTLLLPLGERGEVATKEMVGGEKREAIDLFHRGAYIYIHA